MSDTTELTTEDGFVSALENPALANAIVAKALEEPVQGFPIIQPPSISLKRRLPCGYRVDDKVFYDFEVQELNGIHEERLARIDKAEDSARWFQALLECGVVSVGGHEATPELLKQLLIGDREYLSLVIREVTYGMDVEVGQMQCPKCSAVGTLHITLDEIPVRPFDGNWTFEVPLKNGGKAIVALPDGNTQEALFAPSLTEAERRTVMLAECVQVIERPNGQRDSVAGFPSLIQGLGIVDRNAIMAELIKRQPGPRYNEITSSHECGFESFIAVDLMHLFPGM